MSRPSPLKADLARLWPLLPGLLFLLVFFAEPLLHLLGLGFLDGKGEVSLAQYVRLFSSELYLGVLKNTLVLAFWTTLFAVTIGYPVAYFIATTSPAKSALVTLFVLVPFWTSFLVKTFAWYVLLGRQGAINQTLMKLGLIDTPLQLIYNRLGIMIGTIHVMLPLAIVAMLPVMQSIDRRLLGAAATLGAGKGQTFWRIYFPLSLNGVAAAALVVFISSIGFYITPALLGSGKETMISQVIIDNVTQLMNWNFGAALALLLLVTILLILAIANKTLVLTQGGSGRAAPPPDTAWTRSMRRLGRAAIDAAASLTDLVERSLMRLRGSRFVRPSRAIGRDLAGIQTALILFFLIAPTLIVIPVSLSESRIVGWPPSGFTLRWYEEVFRSTVWMNAIQRSFVIGIGSACLAMLLGVPAAFVLSRQVFKGRSFAMMTVLAPMVIPHIIIAVGLFYLFARLGLVGTTSSLIIAHAVLSVPYVVVVVMSVLSLYDTRLDDAGRSLGATKLRVLRHVTLPLIYPGLLSAFLVAFVISFDELTIALFTTGGIVTTVPKQMWDDAILQINPTITAVSTLILIFVTLLILVAEWARARSGMKQK